MAQDKVISFVLNDTKEKRVRIYYWRNNNSWLENITQFFKGIGYRITSRIPYLGSRFTSPLPPLLTTGHVAIKFKNEDNTKEYICFWPGRHGSDNPNDTPCMKELDPHYHQAEIDDWVEGEGHEIIDLYTLDIQSLRENIKAIKENNNRHLKFSVIENFLYPLIETNAHNCCTKVNEVLCAARVDKLLDKSSRLLHFKLKLIFLLIYGIKKLTYNSFAKNNIYAKGSRLIFDNIFYVLGGYIASNYMNVIRGYNHKYVKSPKLDQVFYYYDLMQLPFLFTLGYALIRDFRNNHPILSLAIGGLLTGSKKAINTLYFNILFTPKAMFDLGKSLEKTEHELYPIRLSQNENNAQIQNEIGYIHKFYVLIKKMVAEIDPIFLDIGITILSGLSYYAFKEKINSSILNKFGIFSAGNISQKENYSLQDKLIAILKPK